MIIDANFEELVTLLKLRLSKQGSVKTHYEDNMGLVVIVDALKEILEKKNKGVYLSTTKEDHK